MSRPAAAIALTIDTVGPNFGAEPLLDVIADSPALATFVGEHTRLLWPADYDLRRIAVRGPTPVYPHSLIWRTYLAKRQPAPRSGQPPQPPRLRAARALRHLDTGLGPVITPPRQPSGHDPHQRSAHQAIGPSGDRPIRRSAGPGGRSPARSGPDG
ncbi:MAG: hypothetical protein ABR926_04670 [Streptosporangiaceae bacterium]